MKLFLLGSALLAGLLLSGCDSECCQNVELTQSVSVKGNQTPIPVITGLPATVQCGTELTVSASQSHDPDGTIHDYAWKLDNQEIVGAQTTTAKLPCDGKEHTICLTVTDDKGASQTTCQTVAIDNAKPPVPAGCGIKPKITFEKADEEQYKFYCAESTYNGTKIDDATAEQCEWFATKTFLDDSIDKHGESGPVKWVGVDPDTFKALDLTLTVKKGDCEATITEHYLIPQDLPY